MVVLCVAPEHHPFNSTADLYTCHSLQVNVPSTLNREIHMRKIRTGIPLVSRLCAFWDIGVVAYRILGSFLIFGRSEHPVKPTA